TRFSRDWSSDVCSSDLESEAVVARCGGGGEAGFVDEAEIVPAVAARVALARVRADALEQVEGAEREVRHLVPEPVVAAAPDVPRSEEHTSELQSRENLV